MNKFGSKYGSAMCRNQEQMHKKINTRKDTQIIELGTKRLPKCSQNRYRNHRKGIKNRYLESEQKNHQKAFIFPKDSRAIFGQKP